MYLVQYNGGLLPDIILLTQMLQYYHRGTRLNAMRSFLYLQPIMIPSKRFDIFLCSEGLGAF